MIHARRARLAVFAGAALLLVAISIGAIRFVQTLQRLDLVDLERDQWQRPAEVMEALQAREGGVVADVGCGPGYFALKLARVVGEKGEILAVDIRRQPLLLLWVRSWIRALKNIRPMLGRPDDPRLPAEGVDAVLVANAYHEMSEARSVLTHVFRALRRGGRLVILDRGGRLTAAAGPPADEPRDHRASPSRAEAEIRQIGFDIVERDDRFVSEQGDDVLWWLIVARKP